MTISTLTPLVIATVFAIIATSCYIWAYLHYSYISKDKTHSILFKLSGGKWPPDNLKLKKKITIPLYKTVIIMLINIMLNDNRNKNLKPQTTLTLLLIITQIIELWINKSLKRKSLIYYTCTNSILVLITSFTLAGLIINLLQIILNSKSIHYKRIDKLHYWYWKCFIITWNAMFVLMFR